MSTQTPIRTDAFEDSIKDVIGLARMWAAHGLNIGAEALNASARSLEVTSKFLAELRTQLDESEATEAPAKTTVDAIDGEPTPEA